MRIADSLTRVVIAGPCFHRSPRNGLPILALSARACPERSRRGSNVHPRCKNSELTQNRRRRPIPNSQTTRYDGVYQNLDRQKLQEIRWLKITTSPKPNAAIKAASARTPPQPPWPSCANSPPQRRKNQASNRAFHGYAVDMLGAQLESPL